MRPDGIGSATVSLAFTGIDEIYLIYIAVTVPVVLAPVLHLVFHQLDSLMGHFCRVLVITLEIVTTIIRLRFRHGNWSHDIEGQLKLAFALGIEVVIHRPHEITLIKILLIGNAYVKGTVVAGLERDIREINQDDQALFLSEIGTYFTDATALQPLGTARIGCSTASLRVLFHSLGIHLREIIMAVDLLIRLAVVCHPKVTIFVTNQTGIDNGSVTQCNRSCHVALGRNGQY